MPAASPEKFEVFTAEGRKHARAKRALLAREARAKRTLVAREARRHVRPLATAAARSPLVDAPLVS